MGFTAFDENHGFRDFRVSVIFYCLCLSVKRSMLRLFRCDECKDDVDWLKWCMKMETKGTWQRGCLRKTWWNCVKGDMESFGLSHEDAQDSGHWRLEIRLTQGSLETGVRESKAITVNTRFEMTTEELCELIIMGGSVLAAECGVQTPFFGQWAAATCAAPPSVIAGQYATSNCKPLLVRVSL